MSYIKISVFPTSYLTLSYYHADHSRAPHINHRSDAMRLSPKPIIPVTSQHSGLHSTSVLFIDGFEVDRTYFAEHLKRCSLDYHVLEAADARSGLEVYRSRRIDCVVVEIALPDRSGFEVLKNLVPHVSRLPVAVIVLTQFTYGGLRELAKKKGAYDCFIKRHTTVDDLDRAIPQAISFVGQMPRDDRYQLI
jgi:CheY-like chemotaxis protein